MNVTCGRLVARSIAGLLTLAPAAAWAQAYPAKPVTMVVPWPAGGSTDIVMRAISEAAAKQLGQPIVSTDKIGLAKKD